VLRLCGPATGENRTVGSQDRTVGKKRTKKHFYSLGFKLGQTATKSAKKSNKSQTTTEFVRQISNILARLPTPPSRTGTPKTRTDRSKSQNERASQHGSERAGGEEPSRRGGDSRIGSGEVGALEL